MVPRALQADAAFPKFVPGGAVALADLVEPVIGRPRGEARGLRIGQGMESLGNKAGDLAQAHWSPRARPESVLGDQPLIPQRRTPGLLVASA